jgi:Tol biopolymer transport system component
MRLFAVAACAALAAVSAGATNKAVPARNGAIAFVTPWPSYDIATVEPDGSGRAMLVEGPADDSDPAWSPDGSMLAFSSDRDGDREIYVMDAKNGAIDQLTHNSIADWDPTWAPTGARIAFVRTWNGRIITMRADGSRQERLTSVRRRYQAPAWSPNGKSIAVLGRKGLEMLDLASRRVRRVPRVGEGPVAWSPDGTRIAFTHQMDGGCDVYEVPPRKLQAPATPVPCVGLVISRPNGRVIKSWYNRDQDYSGPVWSPDGTAMVLGVYSELHTFRFGVAGSFRSLGVDGADPSWQPLCSIGGGVGADVLRGTNGRDLVCGFDGNDRLNGGKGADRLFGGSGDDNVLARDGVFDVIGCGAGRDSVTADRSDLLGVDCERIRR